MTDKDTYRIFSCVVYEENEQFYRVLQNTLKNNLDYIYILHDRDDVNPHYHFVIYTKIATTISKISKLLDLPCNYINTYNMENNIKKRYTMKQTISYLIHYKMQDKYNYPFEDVKTNIYPMCQKYYNILTNNKEDNREINEIIAFIDDNDIRSLKEVIHFCLENNYTNTLKKYQYILIQYIRSVM